MPGGGRGWSVGTFDATRETVSDICRRYRAPSLLDVGCGPGDLLLSLAPVLSHGLGVDISEERIRTARERSHGLDHLHFQVTSVEQLPSSVPAPFDVVLFMGSLEHMPDPQLALEAARTRAHRGSRVVVVAISPGAPHARASRYMLKRSRNPVVAHLGAANLRPLAERAGFLVEEVRPLRRGSGRGRPGRALGVLLEAYDRLGGPTSAVVLRPTASPTRSPGSEKDACRTGSDSCAP